MLATKVVQTKDLKGLTNDTGNPIRESLSAPSKSWWAETMSYNAKTDRNLSKTKLKDNDFMLLLDQIKSAETWLSSPVS